MAQWQGAHVKEDLRLALLSREFSEFSRAEALAYAGLPAHTVAPLDPAAAAGAGAAVHERRVFCASTPA